LSKLMHRFYRGKNYPKIWSTSTWRWENPQSKLSPNRPHSSRWHAFARALQLSA
jgi:hypothetical protein